MARLIDADDLTAKMNEIAAVPWNHQASPVCWADAYYEFIDDIENAPTVDAVEVVRCKDCRHCEVTPDSLRWCKVWAGINGMGDEGFCNYGERRTEK